MITKLVPNRSSKPKSSKKKQAKKVLRKLVECDLMRRVSYEEYRDKVRDVYSGPQGALLAACSVISLHTPFGEKLLRERQFDLAGARSILDVGSGAGQIARNLLKYADPEAKITCVDLSAQMLCRARKYLKSDRPSFSAADLSALPFADGSFDVVTCGYVLEHLPDARPGLAEMSRVLVPGGRMLLLVTEDSFSGIWTSRLWRCRTHNRAELYRICQQLGLRLKKELWFTKMHRMLRAGGICIEIERQ